MKNGFIYIIQSQSNGTYYIGSSDNIEQRLIEHNAGKTTSTKNKGPWMIKFKQEYPTIQIARRLEYKLKKLKRKDYIEKIIREGYIKISGA